MWMCRCLLQNGIPILIACWCTRANGKVRMQLTCDTGTLLTCSCLAFTAGCLHNHSPFFLLGNNCNPSNRQNQLYLPSQPAFFLPNRQNAGTAASGENTELLPESLVPSKLDICVCRDVTGYIVSLCRYNV